MQSRPLKSGNIASQNCDRERLAAFWRERERGAIMICGHGDKAAFDDNIRCRLVGESGPICSRQNGIIRITPEAAPVFSRLFFSRAKRSDTRMCLRHGHVACEALREEKSRETAGRIRWLRCKDEGGEAPPPVGLGRKRQKTDSTRNLYGKRDFRMIRKIRGATGSRPAK